MDCKAFTPTAWYAATDSWECANCYNAPPTVPEPPPSPWPYGYGMTPTQTVMCGKCGAIVGDTVMHNDFHWTVECAVERANNSVQHDDGI